ncbi:SMC-Scp complex subunit ScpB [Anaerorhabdus sp.]|uniref:SMC-Scp complex subunit ScpB n=1 Tax=Anaerorhabdus sp. TaxID=1872524 RepID=UPI002FCB06D4
MTEILNDEQTEVVEEITTEIEEKIDEAIEENNKVEEGNRAGTILEGLLFIVGEEGITLQQASEVLGISFERCETEFKLLQDAYADDCRGFEIANYGGVYKFLSKAIVHPYAEKLFQTTKTAGISQAALETLAIIAYKQPITRVEIEEIRGVGCDMMLRKLEARNLIRENGRSEAPGRPILYEVTDEFMDSFKLLSLEELPKLPEFDTEANNENLFD